VKSNPGTPLRAGLALLALLLACSAPEPAGTPPYAVIRRVDGAAGRMAEPLKLGTHSRHAVALPAGEGFELSLAEPVRGIVFSIGASAPQPLRFEVSARSRGRWLEIFAVEVGPGEPSWSDRGIEASRIPDDARHFRFETRADGPEEATAYWGGIAFLGDARQVRDAPNVILLSLDTLSASYLSSFGDVPGVSPHIDAFLDEGFSFRRALAQYGNTLVSHTSLFTALYPRRHSRYPHSAFVPFESLVGNLADAGYRTAAFTEGAFVASAWGFGRGFDAYDDGAVGLSKQTAGGAARTFERAGRWLECHAGSSRFFLFVHTYEVHLPYRVEDPAEWEVVERFTPGDSRRFPSAFQTRGSFGHNSGRRLFSPRDLAHLRALHAAEIHRLDGVVGRFLERLVELGLERDTLVVLTSDHGDQFGEHGSVGHGNSLHNRVLHVPLGFRWPGRIPAGTSDTPVQLVDVLPTVLDLAGLPVSGELDGRSLAALMRGEAPQDRPAFSEMLSARGECQRLELPDDCRIDRYAVQTRRFKLIASRVPSYEELYDLALDPLETRDVAAEHPDELARHRALLERYLAAPAGEPAAGDAAALDAQTRAQLEALGYLQ
jgi:arylsulfatase A-like enzyme